MPFTPFHLGPGYLAAAASTRRPAWFSFYVFALSQVVIDCETLFNILTGAPRLHTFFHTFAGSLVAGGLTLLVYRAIYIPVDTLLRLGPGLKASLARARLWDPALPPWKTAGVTALAGAWSHVLFDAVDHSDVRPFWPWSGANPLNELLLGGDLYLAFFLCGVAAALVQLLRNRRAP